MQIPVSTQMRLLWSLIWQDADSYQKTAFLLGNPKWFDSNADSPQSHFPLIYTENAVEIKTLSRWKVERCAVIEVIQSLGFITHNLERTICALIELLRWNEIRHESKEQLSHSIQGVNRNRIWIRQRTIFGQSSRKTFLYFLLFLGYKGNLQKSLHSLYLLTV